MSAHAGCIHFGAGIDLDDAVEVGAGRAGAALPGADDTVDMPHRFTVGLDFAPLGERVAYVMERGPGTITTAEFCASLIEFAVAVLDANAWPQRGLVMMAAHRVGDDWRVEFAERGNLTPRRRVRR